MISAVCLKAPRTTTLRCYIHFLREEKNSFYVFKYSYITVGNGRHPIILTQFNISFLVLIFLGLEFGHNYF